ncbi:MAG: hypothetical protein NZ839_01585 [Endomicrobia bacterium]|nr:hypothetical protein [Endomicrobiia bacterium]
MKNCCVLIAALIISFLNLYGMKTEVFNYKIYSTDNFEIYYSKPELGSILPEVESILEDSFRDNTEYFDIKFNYKIPFFIYYGYQQFLQNTIVNVTEHTGGVTEAFKNRFLVPYTGSKKFLQHVINHELVHEMEYNILYSGVWRTPLLLKSIFYPNWLMEGLAEYRSAIFTKTQQEMLVRDMAISDKLIPLEHLHNFAHLKPHMVLPAYEQSAKLMEFIEKEYGKNRLASILKIYREKFDANSVLNITIGNTLNKLQHKFFEEMKTVYNYEVVINSMTDLDSNKKISSDSIYPVHYYSPVMYENMVIYLSDIDGKLFFYSKHNNQKPKMLIPKHILEKNVDVISIDYSRISVSTTGVLCFIGLKNNKSYLYLYELKSKKMIKLDMKNVVDFFVSSYITSDGIAVYFSGIKNCRSVIYQYNLINKKLTKLKEDENFISQLCVNFGKIIYVKEVPCKKQNIYTWQNEIFIYEIATGEEYQLTNSLCDEKFPWFYDNENILFISDYSKDYDKKFFGVNNLYMININNPEKFLQLSNVIGGITYVFTSGETILLLYYRNFNQHIYRYLFNELYKEDNINFTQNLDISKFKFFPEYSKNIKRYSFPYKFTFSTDLFLPFLYYSSYEGLVMLLYWQGSDMVGEHNIGVSSVVLGDKNYYADIVYQFLRFPPVFTLNFKTQGIYNPTQQSMSRYNEVNFAVSFNLDRLSYIDIILGYLQLDKEYSLPSYYKYTKYENFVYFSYTKNSIIGKFLEPSKGSYHNIAAKISDRFYNGNFSYVIWRYFYINYIDLGKEYGLFNKLELFSSTGKDKIKFYLGGPDRIAGFWFDEKTTFSGGCYRFGIKYPIVYDINYYMWYIFPDFFLKSLYGETFLDTGIDEKIKFYTSVGLRFKLYSFVLQTYVLKFELTFGSQLEVNKPIHVYFRITGGF